MGKGMLDGVFLYFYVMPEESKPNAFNDRLNAEVGKLVSEARKILDDNKIKYTVANFKWETRIYINRRNADRAGPEIIHKVQELQRRVYPIFKRLKEEMGL